MSQSYKRKKLADAVPDSVESGPSLEEGKHKKKSTRKEVDIKNLTKEVEELVRDFSLIDAQQKELKEAREKLVEKAIELAARHNVDDFVAESGKVQIVEKKASRVFDKTKAEKLLTKEQYMSCFKTGSLGGKSVKFLPSKK